MIVPENLSLEELIGAMKVVAESLLRDKKRDKFGDAYFKLSGDIYMLETVKRYIDEKLGEKS